MPRICHTPFAPSRPSGTTRVGAAAVTGASLLLATLSATPALAQTQVVKPPVARYWMDVATMSMAGMDNLPDMSGMPGMGGGMFGGGARAGAASTFGHTKGMMPGRWLDLAVVTQLKPAGTQATQAIPPGQAMGPSLVLLPPPPERTPRPQPVERDGPDTHEVPEQPKGRLLLYWGCGDTVRPGQPKVLDFSKAGFEDYGRFMAGRSDRERGATAAPGHAIWPNAQHSRRVPQEASLVGAHAVSGEGIPSSLRFTLGQAQDFMPRLALAAQGGGASATHLQWPALPTARAYFLNAMGGSDDEMVIWSSSEQPEPGWGLLNYASNANVDKWLAEKVLLPTSQTRCAIPAGIFAKTDGGMVQGIAYGQELNLVHPPRPADPRQAWEQEWTARVRVKSVAMLPLQEHEAHRGASPRGMGSMAGTPGAMAEPSEAEAPTPSEPTARETPSIPGLPAVGNVLKGLFGR